LLQENIGKFGHIFFITEKGGGQKLGCEANGKGSKLKSNNNSKLDHHHHYGLTLYQQTM
jgi:hypothetical protein